MTDATQGFPLPAERPPAVTAGPIAWLRANLFDGAFNTILTILAAGLLAVAVPPLVRWAFIDAVWHAGSGQACRGGGACWAFIGEKLRFILFGPYPYA
jgi:general L-amino acid transport system permease protein